MDEEAPVGGGGEEGLRLVSPQEASLSSQRLLGKVGVVSAMTAISRIFGLVREIFMAQLFGTGTLQSAFVIAFRIPNLFRRLFGEGALGAAFIPVFTEIMHAEGHARAQQFFARILGLMVCVLGVLVGLGVAATYGVEAWCGDGSRWTEAMPLMRIMLPYALLICVAAIVSAVLNIHDRFSIPSLTPVVLNIVWIVVLLGVCPFLPKQGYWRIGAVSWGVLVAGLAQVLFQLPDLCRVGYRLRISFSGWNRSPHVRQVLLQMGPASLGIALSQINICVDGWLAFYGATWAPSALEYADRIIYLPLGLFGTAFATVLLPAYSRQATAGNHDEIVATLDRSLRSLLFIMSPMALGLMVLAMPVVSLIYERGAFNADSVVWTARAVVAYAPGLLVFSSAKTIIPVFYARKDLCTPVKVASWCILGNFSLNLLSVLLLPEGWRHVGIAVSTVFNSLANTVILIVILTRQGLKPDLRGLFVLLVKTLLAAGAMAVAVWETQQLLVQWVPLLFSVFVAIVVGGLVYVSVIAGLAPAAFRETLSDISFYRRKRRTTA